MSIIEIAATSPGLPVEDLRQQEPADEAGILARAEAFFPSGTWVKIQPGQDLGSPLGHHGSQVILAVYGPTTLVRSSHAHLLPDIGGSFIRLEYNDISQSVHLEVSGAAGNRQIIGSDTYGLRVDTHGHIGKGTPLPFETEFRSRVEVATAAMWFTEFSTWAFGFSLIGEPVTQEVSVNAEEIAFHVITPVPQGISGAHYLGQVPPDIPHRSWWRRLRA
ncbi:hypothetical protein [Corynebacterium sp. A21]|uniref:hypothetical protein n=1 Tax=Corynebacterium sp. A21 TaxID=3457318 RepID=UPI003FD18B52